MFSLKNDNTFSKDIYKILIICFILFLCNILFLANTSIYWDDWVWLDNNNPTGSVGGIHLFSLRSLFNYNTRNNVFFTRILLFTAEVIGAVCLYLSLRFFKTVHDWSFYITLLASTVPIYIARYTLSCFTYYTSLCWFYMGVFFYFKYISSFNQSVIKKIAFLVISIIFFIKSFSTMSFLVYYIVPFIGGYVFLHGINGLKIWKSENLRNIFLFIRNNIIFVCLPFVFFAIYKFYGQPTGIYKSQNYNVIRLDNIIYSPLIFIRVFTENLKNILSFTKRTIIDHISLYIILALIIFFPIYKLYTFFSPRENEDKPKYEKTLDFVTIARLFLLIGFFATFAYSAVGKKGTIIGFESRHLCLCGIPFALLFLLIVLFFTSTKNGIKVKLVKFFLILLIFLFTLDRIYSSYKMYQEHLKQDFLINNIQKSDIIKTHEIFFINWDSDFFLYEIPHFYELSGYCYKAFGTRDHLIFGQDHDLNFILSIKNLADYKISDVQCNTVQGIIDFRFYPTFKQTIKSLYLQLFQKNKLYEYLEGIGTFSVALVE